ncbi:hypothetical protein FB593_102517 [Rhizobium sp. SJZ105]|uniref:hypothetical protein n=1 Tax=Rhizobium sp. SJZ105 TaxID=2572678 RepID=UPI0011A661E5|nr:hypothetical protein [Rhizobium sp. SJZ105]TWC85665.1 hypothetical protein FB593_102517 [Rhizobium sp. SJZ105]
MTALYISGTIALVNGSPVINGIDTAWKTALIVGGTVHVEAEGNPLPILPDDSAGASEHPITDTQMTAAIKWQGASGTYKYALVRENTYTSQQSANATAVSELLRRLNNPTIAAIAGVQGEQDHLILLTGPSTATIIPRTSLIQGIEADATVETPANLVTYDGEAAGFIVLVSNAGNQRAALYFKKSATAGDWSAPAFLTGEKGDQGNIGPTGITWRGAWNGAAAYSKNDVVQNNKSAWIALRANANVAPPVLPTTANADWELFARAGVDGTGTGDVVGPAAAVSAGALAQFTTTDGKTLGPATIGSPALLGRVAAGVGEVERLTPAQARQVLGGWVFIGDYVLDGLTGLDINNLGAFRSLRIQCSFIANGNTSSGLRFSSDNGSSFYMDNDEFAYTLVQNSTASGGNIVNGDENISSVAPSFGDHSGATGWANSSTVLVHSFNNNRNAIIHAQTYGQVPNGRYIREVGSANKRAISMNALRMALTSATTIQYGRFYIEGMKG